MLVLPIYSVLLQHSEEVGCLYHQRTLQLTQPHIKIHLLQRLDERLTAHLDGLIVAGEQGIALCQQALEFPSVGAVFAAAVLAIQNKDLPRLNQLFALAGALPETQLGLHGAFAWVEASELQGTVVQLLAAEDGLRREVGLRSCVAHGVVPGAALNAALLDEDARLRACALQAVGELGVVELLPACVAALQSSEPACVFYAARSALLLGEREQAVEVLQGLAVTAGPWQCEALLLVLKALDLPQAQLLLKQVGQTDKRLLIQGVGLAGDAQYLPWLIARMAEPEFARVAGEAFAMITGVDIAYLDLDGDQPEGFDAGPSEDPDDDNVALDQDDYLPWPHPAKMRAWWHQHQGKFQSGVRYFVGAPVDAAHCLQVLRTGFQRQRIHAAQHLSLLAPGTALFNTSAPVRRQLRLLQQMGAA